MSKSFETSHNCPQTGKWSVCHANPLRGVPQQASKQAAAPSLDLTTYNRPEQDQYLAAVSALWAATAFPCSDTLYVGVRQTAQFPNQLPADQHHLHSTPRLLTESGPGFATFSTSSTTVFPQLISPEPVPLLSCHEGGCSPHDPSHPPVPPCVPHRHRQRQPRRVI